MNITTEYWYQVRHNRRTWHNLEFFTTFPRAADSWLQSRQPHTGYRVLEVYKMSGRIVATRVR